MINRRELLQGIGGLLGSLMLVGIEKKELNFVAEDFVLDMDKIPIGKMCIAVCEIDTWEDEKFICKRDDEEMLINFIENYATKNEERLMREGKRSLLKSIWVKWMSVREYETGYCVTENSLMYFKE